MLLLCYVGRAWGRMTSREAPPAWGLLLFVVVDGMGEGGLCGPTSLFLPTALRPVLGHVGDVCRSSGRDRGQAAPFRGPPPRRDPCMRERCCRPHVRLVVGEVGVTWCAARMPLFIPWTEATARAADLVLYLGPGLRTTLSHTPCSSPRNYLPIYPVLARSVHRHCPGNDSRSSGLCRRAARSTFF